MLRAQRCALNVLRVDVNSGESRWTDKYGITRLDIEALQRVFRQLDTNGRGKIGPDDLAHAFERLDYQPNPVTGINCAVMKHTP